MQCTGGGQHCFGNFRIFCSCVKLADYGSCKIIIDRTRNETIGQMIGIPPIEYKCVTVGRFFDHVRGKLIDGIVKEE